MATDTDTTPLGVANEIMNMSRRIDALRLTCVGLRSKGWEVGYDEDEQSVMDLQAGARALEKAYDAECKARDD
jgi:hypothetical protein